MVTTDAQIERVRALVAAIPPGRVATYGDIAAAAGLASARTVGWIMRTDSADLPWHRVIGASGRPAAHLAERQLHRLATEGVPIRDGRVDLRRRVTFDDHDPGNVTDSRSRVDESATNP